MKAAQRARTARSCVAVPPAQRRCVRVVCRCICRWKARSMQRWRAWASTRGATCATTAGERRVTLRTEFVPRGAEPRGISADQPDVDSTPRQRRWRSGDMTSSPMLRTRYLLECEREWPVAEPDWRAQAPAVDRDRLADEPGRVAALLVKYGDAVVPAGARGFAGDDASLMFKGGTPHSMRHSLVSVDARGCDCGAPVASWRGCCGTGAVVLPKKNFLARPCAIRSCSGP